MKISYNWLRDYLKTDLAPEQLSVILTDIGLEVESLEKVEAIKGGLEGVVVGKVLTCEKHPDADKLSLTTVDVGSGEALQIVCGAPNVAAGQKVFVATINATLYPNGAEEGFKIKRSKIRGVESLGMICAEDELGIGSDHSGIIVLDDKAAIGTGAAVQLGLGSDYVFEIGLTPNRIDAASHFGVARDVAAWLRASNRKGELVMPSVEAYLRDEKGREVDIRVLDTEGAPRYTGVTVTGVKVAPSPDWLQRYLRAIGINPKNNVVDISNFILHELGQPLHCFDADKIAGDCVVVKTCLEGTKFTTLDGVERTLSGEDLMICDSEKPMCIAGVFGGLDSGVTEQTKSVFIESAYFNPVRIRKTSRRHGLKTDASFRFERGTDPDITVYAIKRAALLIKELAGGRITSDIIDHYPAVVEPFRFDISLQRINALIGKEIPESTVRSILSALEIWIDNEENGIWTIAVPPYRVDVRREADIAEEILRLYGFNNVDIPEKVYSSMSHIQRPDRDKINDVISNLLTDNGFYEIMSNSLTKSDYYKELKSYPESDCVRILNPLSGDLNAMRQTLLFNALEAIVLNANRRNSDLKFYEFGNCYRYDHSREEEGGLAPYVENARLGIAMTGDARTGSWNVSAEKSGFFALKSYIERILKRFGIDIFTLGVRESESDLFDGGYTWSVGNKELFTMGKASSAICRRFDLKAEVWFAEMNFDQLFIMARKAKIAAHELSKFPEVHRDLALLVDDAVTFAQLKKIALSAEGKLLKNVTLFDVYQGDKLPAGKKSYAIGLVLEDKTRTMTDPEIDKAVNNVVAQLEKSANAAVRS